MHDGAGRRADVIGRLRWFYFLVYAGVGTWLSYFAPYLRGLGFSGEDIGAVTMAQQLTSVPAALVWGSIGDRLGAPARALRICAGDAAADGGRAGARGDVRRRDRPAGRFDDRRGRSP
ncbi:MAG: hypothetical protein E6J88_11655 [Deltaproteobacteria bacterium]|nr:MAG: hypothetical protein E6J88_11655 [Deltaproteobacteria bacterium]